MAFTRFKYDKCRVEKQLQEATGPGRYMVDVPGNGTKPCFMEDPYVRMQKWGANLRTNTINLESSLMGIGQPLTRDCVDSVVPLPKNNAIEYPSCTPFTEQPRATMPAWTARDLEQNNFQILPLDPQENTCMPFHNNINTRLIEWDNFIAKVQCVDVGSGPATVTTAPFNAQPHGSTGPCNSVGTCGTVNQK